MLHIRICWNHVILDKMQSYWVFIHSTDEDYFSPLVIWLWFNEKKVFNLL